MKTELLNRPRSSIFHTINDLKLLLSRHAKRGRQIYDGIWSGIPASPVFFFQTDGMLTRRSHAVANAGEGCLPTDERSETGRGGGVLSPRNRNASLY